MTDAAHGADAAGRRSRRPSATARWRISTTAGTATISSSTPGSRCRRSRPRASTLSQVKALIRHPLFSLTAPNKVRALIGVFAMQNPVQFNRPDGAGYAFVAKQVARDRPLQPLDRGPSCLAAFRNWHGLEPGRRAQARRTLQEVAKAPEISRDVYEIVTKMLDQ